MVLYGKSMSGKKCVFIMCYMYLVEGTARFSCVKKYLKADLGQSRQLPIIVIRVWFQVKWIEKYPCLTSYYLLQRV